MVIRMLDKGEAFISVSWSEHTDIATNGLISGLQLAKNNSSKFWNSLDAILDQIWTLGEYLKGSL